jgi:hypothetical protein
MLKNIYHNHRILEQSIKKDTVQSLEKNTVIQSKNLNTKQKVDINQLLNRVKQNKKIEKKEKLIFFGLVFSTICTMGIFLALTN